MKLFQVGDWVRGKTNDGELFHGYIHSDENFSQSMKVRVIKSDNVGLEGNVISANHSKMKALESSVSYSNEAIRDLIDVALLIKDEEWFMELTGMLPKKNKKGVPSFHKSTSNRIEKRQNI